MLCLAMTLGLIWELIMCDESTKCFQYDSKVKYKTIYYDVYTVKAIRNNNGIYIYMLESLDGRHQLAFHEELKPHYDINIEAGDEVSYLGNYHTVEQIVGCLVFFKNQIGSCHVNEVTLITRATRSELLNAMHNLYGGTIQNLNSDYYKMGHIKEQYGYLVFKKILSNRIR